MHVALEILVSRSQFIGRASALGGPRQVSCPPAESQKKKQGGAKALPQGRRRIRLKHYNYLNAAAANVILVF
jgi:hypothetical protein